jgi:hypothetical protein
VVASRRLLQRGAAKGGKETATEMKPERNQLGGPDRHGIVGKRPHLSSPRMKTAFAWRETIARPFIPSGPSYAIAMPPLLRREPAA